MNADAAIPRDEAVKRGARILVVDSQPLVRLGLVALIRSEPDLEVVGEAASCAEACAMARTLAPDSILLGLELGDATGYEALVQVCSAQPRCAVIVLSAGESERLVRQAVSQGVRAYLHKSAPAELICQALRTVHAGGHYLDPAATRMVLAEVASRKVRRGAADGGLSEREKDVLELLADGKRTRDISQILVISERTVKHHISLLLKRFHAASRSEVLRHAAAQGLLHRPRLRTRDWEDGAGLDKQ